MNGEIMFTNPISEKEMGFFITGSIFSENLSGIFQGRIDSRRKET